jgi:hypothetical protein
MPLRSTGAPVYRAEDPCLIIGESTEAVCKEKENIENHDVYEIEV